MEVLTKDKCPECDGVGILAAAVWVEFYELEQKRRKETGEDYSQEEVEEHFRKKGYLKLPSEEHGCSECGGVGTIEKWIDIKELASLTSTTKTE